MSGHFAGRRFIADNAKPFRQKSVATAPLIFKSSPLTIDDIDEPAGVISAYVNSMETVDLQGDVIHRGAWNSVLNEMRAGRQNWPSLLIGHNWEKGVGVVSDAHEAGDKLQITGRFAMKSAAGREAFELVRAGVYKDYSVGFAPGDRESDAHGVNHIRSIALFPEVSIVLVGASPGTGTLLAKGAPYIAPHLMKYVTGRRHVDWQRVEQLVVERLGKARRDQGPVLFPEPYIDPDARRPFNPTHDVIAGFYDDPIADEASMEAFLARVSAGEAKPER